MVAVAETLVEMGRRFDDDKILNEAIAQYKFLRKEYPGSKYRCDALFTIGEIYKDDLNDPEQARSCFRGISASLSAATGWRKMRSRRSRNSIATAEREKKAEAQAEEEARQRDSGGKSKTAEESAGEDVNAEDRLDS